MMQAIFFDMDGLLINSEPIWKSAENDIFAKFDVHINPKEYLQTSGMRLDGTVAYWGSHRDIPEAYWKQMLVDIESRVAETITDAALMPGAEEALHHAREQGLPMYLVSATKRSIIDIVVSSHGWVDVFDRIVAGDDFNPGKPDPAVYIHAAAMAEVPVAKTIVFEDSIHGVTAGVHAGARTIAVSQGDSANDPIMEEAWKHFYSLEDISKETFYSFIQD